MISRPHTDTFNSVAASEFVWDNADATAIHHFVAMPILRLLRHHGARTILDLGCGNGSFSAHIAEQGFEVTGLDHSHSGIAAASLRHPGVTFARHDLSDSLPDMFDQQFDCVISVEVIEHLLLPRNLIESAKKALKPGGMLIVTTPYHGYLKNLALALINGFDNHWHPLRDFGHVKFFSRRTLLQLLAEQGLLNHTFHTVGRIPAFARSMIVSGVKAK
jgi:2-polyprenyl-3-methyl-5-hydroxy-6-metoxy-1,4-benzoquinol methylase